MNHLTVQGSSHHNIFVRCWACRKKFVWLMADELHSSKGFYRATCAKCRKEL